MTRPPLGGGHAGRCGLRRTAPPFRAAARCRAAVPGRSLRGHGLPAQRAGTPGAPRMPAVTEEHLLVGGLGFPEEPRWHAGALWFIDIWRKAVIGADETGAQIGRYELGFRPGGIGWLPDGELVVADLEHDRVMAIEHGTGAQRTHADLSNL